MSRVIERCPNCGVEHELTHVGPCEVCGSELRFWCRRHSKEVGWLEGPSCPVCAREAAAAAARPAPPPPRPPSPSPTRPAPTRERTRPPRSPSPAAERPPARRTRAGAPRAAPGPGRPEVAVRGTSLAWRLLRALLAIVRSVILSAILFGLAGVAYGLYVTGFTLEEPIAIHTLNEDVLLLGVLGLLVGGLIGLLWGLLHALQVLFLPGE